MEDIPSPEEGPENSTSLETAKEIIRLSELYIDGTLKLSIAADARAMQLSGMMVAASTALFGFGMNSIFKAGASDSDKALGLGAITTGLLFFAALLFTLRAAKPRPFNISGTTLAQWSEDELNGRVTLAAALMGQAEVYKDQIYQNITILTKNSVRVRAALWLMFAGPISGLLVGGLFYLHAKGWLF